MSNAILHTVISVDEFLFDVDHTEVTPNEEVHALFPATIRKEN